MIPGSLRSPGEGTDYPLQYSWASLVTQRVKNPLAKWETWVRSLGWEDPPEEGMATHSGFLPGESPWTEEPGRPWGHKEWDMTKRLSLCLELLAKSIWPFHIIIHFHINVY